MPPSTPWGSVPGRSATPHAGPKFDVPWFQRGGTRASAPPRGTRHCRTYASAVENVGDDTAPFFLPVSLEAQGTPAQHVKRRFALHRKLQATVPAAWLAWTTVLASLMHLGDVIRHERARGPWVPTYKLPRSVQTGPSGNHAFFPPQRVPKKARRLDDSAFPP